MKFNKEPVRWACPNLGYTAQVVRPPCIYNGNLAIKGRCRNCWVLTGEEAQIIQYTFTEPFDDRPQCDDGACEQGNALRQKDLLETVKEGELSSGPRSVMR